MKWQIKILKPMDFTFDIHKQSYLLSTRYLMKVIISALHTFLWDTLLYTYLLQGCGLVGLDQVPLMVPVRVLCPHDQPVERHQRYQMSNGAFSWHAGSWTIHNPSWELLGHYWRQLFSDALSKHWRASARPAQLWQGITKYPKYP